MDYNKIIGTNIRFERQRRDLTIEELSEILNIAPGFLGLIERGQRGTSIKNLCKIANFFSITLDELITQMIAGSGDTVNEAPTSTRDIRYSTAASLMHNLNLEELEFMIIIIKSLKRLTKSKMANIADVFDDSDDSDDSDVDY